MVNTLVGEVVGAKVEQMQSFLLFRYAGTNVSNASILSRGKTNDTIGRKCNNELDRGKGGGWGREGVGKVGRREGEEGRGRREGEGGKGGEEEGGGMEVMIKRKREKKWERDREERKRERERK